MSENIKKYQILIFAFLWLAMWFLPWNVWLDAVLWGRMAFALFMFIVPGVALSMILGGENFTFLAHTINGLALSIFIVGCFGLLGRVLNYPFSFIKPMFVVTGLITLFFLFKQFRSGHTIYAVSKYTTGTVVSLLVIFTLSIVNSFAQRFGGDDFHYLVYQTNWRHADPLSFQWVFTSLSEMDRVRYWINMFPMNLAFIAEIGNLHGLLLTGLYLEPFLVVFALIAAYTLYERLLGSERRAITALLVQFIFLLLFQSSFQFGSSFFNRLSEDKAFAAFILVPVFWGTILYFVQSFTPSSGILTFITGWSLALTHPIILAYSVFVASVYFFIITLLRKQVKRLFIAAALLAAIILPPAILRVVDVPWVSEYILGLEVSVRQPSVFDVETAKARRPNVDKTRITAIEGTPFYGFNLNVIKYRKNVKTATFFTWSYAYILLAGFVWSLFNLRRKDYASFIAAVCLLILVCGIPYTGWLMGYLVSLRMLWRAPWLMPIGLVLFILVEELYRALDRKTLIPPIKVVRQPRAWNYVWIVLGIAVLAVSSINNNVRWNALSKLSSYRNDIERLAGLGNYLEDTLERPALFVSSQKMMNYLAGLSSKSKVFLFQGGGITAGDVGALDQISPLLSTDPSYSIKYRIRIMRKNDLTYILTEEEGLQYYYEQYPQHFSIDEINGFWLIKFNSVIP